MIKIKNLVLLIFAISIYSCQSPNKKLGDFKLLPSPQQFEIKGVSDLKVANIIYYFSNSNEKIPANNNLIGKINLTEKKKEAQLVFEIDTLLTLPLEGYLLDISKKLISIKAKDRAGLFYAFMTLEQVMEDAQEQNVFLPICSINDYPLLSYRAIHLDMKHHMERTDYYYRLMDRLAKYKINAIIAEVEDKIKYVRQPKIGSEDALSIEEWKKLCNYARERNIEISPLVQGLGHASFILKHDEYKSLRDDPNSDWAFNPLDPKTYEVQFDLYLDAIEATPHGKYLHIGGDEVHTTGRNSDKSALELQLYWLNKVSNFAVKHGRIPIFWDDMPLRDAGVYKAMFNVELSEQKVDSIWLKNEPKLLKFLDQFPKNCIYMRWNYNSSNALGNIKAMEWFRKNGMQVMGATAGQTRWVLMPQSESNMDNIKSFAISSINKDLKGLLLTLWDDDSPHFELYLRGIIAFSEYTWSGDKRSKSELKSAYRQREFSSTLSDTSFAFIDELEQPVRFWKNALLKGNKRNYLQSMESPLKEGIIDFPDKNNKGAWSIEHVKRVENAVKMVGLCDSISHKIERMKSKAIRNSYTLEVYEQVNELAQFSSMVLVALNDYDLAKNKEEESIAMFRINKLSEDFKSLREEFESVYSKTRILTKPKNYTIDQDHHVHLASQTLSFDWQFYAEILFLEKIDKELSTKVKQ